jgi:predicted AlkP superfamily phosphohydrolase/phosphomutase/tetratricopeptide (TPR) repeat protein
MPMQKPRKKLLLVGWDSADWKIIQPLIDSGAMPGIGRIVERGVSGNLTTLEPQLSPMLWTSIATGKMAYHHGVPGFTEVDPATNRVVPVSAATRKCSTLWEILGDHGLKSNVVSWFATHGERDHPGCLVSNMFGHVGSVAKDSDPADWPPPPPGTYWPDSLAESMNDLRVSPHDLDPDEVIRAFVPAAHTIDQEKDKRLWVLAEKLGEAFSVHEAATHLLATEPDWDLFAVYYRTVDEISHLFMPYHPPKMEGITEADFELYQHVVSGIYRLHDLFLQRLMQLAGPDVAVMVVSDHGFHSDHLRPKFTPRVPAGITVWHRPQGVFAAAGPGFKTDELVFGARLLDIAPTVLHWFGLPVGDDMEGRLLEEAFDASAEPGGKRRAVTRIPTHEPPDGRRRARAGFGEDADKALLDQFVALGYIDEIPADPGQAAAETNRENDWNMARALMHGQRYAEALPLLEACFHACPFRTDYAQLLASCQMNLGLLAEADATVDRARDSFGQTERADLIKASIAIQRDDHHAALEALERVREKMPDDVQLGLMLARSYLGLRRFADADAAARHVLTIDPHNPQACLVQARIALHADRPADAVDSALAAISLQYGNPMGHWLLGAALYGEGRFEEAEKPLRNCLTLAPDFLRARRLLARVLRGLGRREEALAEEGLGFERARAARERADRVEAECRAAAEARAAARAEADREKQAEIDRKAAELAAIEPLDLLVVSGLPRSGTSLMMQMLRAGGIEPMTDGERLADEDNLEGYFEWEDVKQLPKNPRLIEQAAGKAVKVISALLPSLPAPHRYTIIYMVRPTEQVVNSQWAMLGRRGQAPRSEKQHLIEVQEQHSLQIRKALAASDRVTLLEVSYPELVADPAPVIEKLAALLPGRFTPSPAVAACVKPALYRNRGGAA